MRKVLGTFCLLLLVSSGAAGDGDLLLRARLINVAPNDQSSQILTTGTGVAVDDAFVPEVDLTFMMGDHWGLEIIAATSPHDLSTEGGSLAGIDGGEVWVLPPTLTLQYHFNSGKPVDVYLGLGINYSLFYNYDLSEDLEGLGMVDIDFDNSFGFAANVGVDVQIGKNWVFNLDLKYIDMATDADLMLPGGATLATVAVDIDPYVAGIGFGYRF